MNVIARGWLLDKTRFGRIGQRRKCLNLSCNYKEHGWDQYNICRERFEARKIHAAAMARDRLPHHPFLFPAPPPADDGDDNDPPAAPLMVPSDEDAAAADVPFNRQDFAREMKAWQVGAALSNAQFEGLLKLLSPAYTLSGGDAANNPIPTTVHRLLRQAGLLKSTRGGNTTTPRIDSLERQWVVCPKPYCNTLHDYKCINTLPDDQRICQSPANCREQLCHPPTESWLPPPTPTEVKLPPPTEAAAARPPANPRMTFPAQPLEAAVRQMFGRRGFLSLISHWWDRPRNHNLRSDWTDGAMCHTFVQERWEAKEPDCALSREAARHAAVFPEDDLDEQHPVPQPQETQPRPEQKAVWANDPVRSRGRLLLRGSLMFQLGVDWFSPHKYGNYSVGTIYIAILNLPRHLRFLKENIIVIGVLPGPKEAKSLVPFLAPLVSELCQLWKYGWPKVVSPDWKEPLHIYGALVMVTADMPASRKIAGMCGHMSKHSCTRCTRLFGRGRQSIINGLGITVGLNWGGFSAVFDRPLRSAAHHRKECEKITPMWHYSAAAAPLPPGPPSLMLRCADAMFMCG